MKADRVLIGFFAALVCLLVVFSAPKEKPRPERKPLSLEGIKTVPALGGCPDAPETLYIVPGNIELTWRPSYFTWTTFDPAGSPSNGDYTLQSLEGDTVSLQQWTSSSTSNDDTADTTACTGTMVSFTGTLDGYSISDEIAATNPEISDASINTAGDTLTIVWTENVDGTGGTPTLTASGGAITAGAGSGTDGTNTRTHALSGRVIYSGETVTLDLASAAVTATDDAAVSLAADDFPVTNDSVQSPPPPESGPAPHYTRRIFTGGF